MREKYRKSIASLNKFPQFTTMNVIDGQAGLIIYTSLIFYSLTIDNILNIIVLLILAGVTIATLTGENGIIKQSDKAKIETTKGEEKEAIGLAYNGAKTEKSGEEITAEDVNMQFTKNGAKAIAIATMSNDGLKIYFSETGRSYLINTYGMIEEFDDISNYLKVGDYVKYPDKNGNKILCQVLYNDENYGVQLVSVNPVDTVTLGSNDPSIPSDLASASGYEKAKYSYNNAIKTLNDKAETYRNSQYTDESKARCVGSLPINPLNESEFFSGSYNYLTKFNLNGVFRNMDDNYKEDYNQLKAINAIKLSDTSKSAFYWLASRGAPDVREYRLCFHCSSCVRPYRWNRRC